MGPSVRRLYEQGKSVNGAGINASFAVHQVRSQAAGCATVSHLPVCTPLITFSLQSSTASDTRHQSEVVSVISESHQRRMRPAGQRMWRSAGPSQLVLLSLSVRPLANLDLSTIVDAHQ